MRNLARFLLVLTFAWVAANFCPEHVVADCKPDRGWCAGEYRGLTVGTSKYKDMVRILGKPLSSGPAADQNDPVNFVWHDYGNIKGKLSGRLGIVIDKRIGKIVLISIAPSEITKEEVVRYFGPDYTTMGYEFCEGFEGTSAPTFENPKATELNNIEYRSRGISISIGFRDQVNEVNFVAEPTGLASKEECTKDAGVQERN